jgi:hypothetical protein
MRCSPGCWAGMLVAFVLMPASAAGAGPVLVPESQVGAVLPVQAVAKPQVPVMPPAPRVSGGACAFQFATKPQVPVKHVAPCGGTGGTGAATKPWGTLRRFHSTIRDMSVR